MLPLREGCAFACERTGASELMHSELASSANARALERYAIHVDNMMRCQIIERTSGAKTARTGLGDGNNTIDR